MKKVIIVIYVILIIILLKFLGTYFINELLLKYYNAEDYEKAKFELLNYLNLEERYIAFYNLGNRLYREKNFNEAIAEYEKALEVENIPEEKECSIRINLALSKLGLIKDDYSSEENKEETLKLLGEAKSVLLEENCATNNGDGHSKEAQKLKDEIDEIEKELNNENQEEEEKKEQEKKKEQLKEVQRNSLEERRSQMEYYNLTTESIFSTYDGKQW